MFASEIPSANASLCFAVSYLVVFHVFLMLFVWSYWKTIGSKATGPSEAVRFSRRSHVISCLTGASVVENVAVSVCFAPSREGAVRAGGARGHAAGDPEEGGEEPAGVHSHRGRRSDNQPLTTTSTFIDQVMLF